MYIIYSYSKILIVCNFYNIYLSKFYVTRRCLAIYNVLEINFILNFK